MTKTTKQRILNAALHLFNDWGYINVRLYQIAEQAKMSVGNMAYHYQHKTELFKPLFEDWKKEQEQLLSEIHLTPIFENFELYIQGTFKLQQTYSFLYLDRLELIRNFHEVATNFHEFRLRQQEQFEILLQLYEARAVLDWTKKELSAAFLALELRKKIDFWLWQQLVEGKDQTDFKDFREQVWSVIKPYFTKIGAAEFRN